MALKWMSWNPLEAIGSCYRRWIGRKSSTPRWWRNARTLREVRRMNLDNSGIQYRILTRSTIWTGVTQNLRTQPLEAEERRYMESKDLTKHWESNWEWTWSVFTGVTTQPTQTNPGLVHTRPPVLIPGIFWGKPGNPLPRNRKSPTEN